VKPINVVTPEDHLLVANMAEGLVVPMSAPPKPAKDIAMQVFIPNNPSTPQAVSLTDAVMQVAHSLSVPYRDLPAFSARARHFLRQGLLPGTSIGKGRRSPLSIEQIRILTVALLLNLNGFSSERAIATVNANSDIIMRTTAGTLLLATVPEFLSAPLLVEVRLPR